ncbi:MAG: hypothetical protein WKF87_00785 [Chryseolinea sp.]
MRRFGILFLLVAGSLQAQVRVSKLVIKAHEVYTLQNSDILVADTLIMMDSSRLVMNKLKPENFLRVKVGRFGKDCVIDAKGVNGQQGRSGVNGVTPTGPCLNGTPGKGGTKGLDGTRGINLFVYFERVTIRGKLTIDVSGGNGGRGGSGGNGGGGSPGTMHCNGGNGANGGMAGPGGNGGNGGYLQIHIPKPQTFKDLILAKKVVVQVGGGTSGASGRGGYHGAAGLGPSKKNGKDGEPGPYNKAGISGEKGSMVIQIK